MVFWWRPIQYVIRWALGRCKVPWRMAGEGEETSGLLEGRARAGLR